MKMSFSWNALESETLIRNLDSTDVPARHDACESFIRRIFFRWLTSNLLLRPKVFSQIEPFSESSPFQSFVGGCCLRD